MRSLALGLVFSGREGKKNKSARARSTQVPPVRAQRRPAVAVPRQRLAGAATRQRLAEAATRQSLAGAVGTRQPRSNR